MELLSDYDYVLPESLIAQEPLEDRAASKLLVLNRLNGEVQHRSFQDVPNLLSAGDLLVMNNTRVTALRLFGSKLTGAKVEALLLSDTPQDKEYIALMRPGKRLQPDTVIEFENGLLARVLQDLGDGKKLLRFENSKNLQNDLLQIGQIPLPPYIHTRLGNAERYQTVYSLQGGSAAAPTAGLHFTPEILNELKSKGIQLASITLDVGIDTFRPIHVEKLSEVVMHGEKCTVSEETAEMIDKCKGRIIAVGTTAVRTLESFATSQRKINSGTMVSSIFIYPGYSFKIIDGMFTNFHMPKTSMLMLISALAGREQIFSAYEEAKKHNYRFLSFGDSMLIQ